MRLWLVMSARVLLAVAMLAGLSQPALATREYILPTLFDVEGVRADDVLNIRAEPSATAGIIGTLSADTRDIEVVEFDATGRWARINRDERTGWVAARYLAYQVGIWEDGGLPPSLVCHGTEPFWALRPAAEEITLSRPDHDEMRLPLRRVLSSPVFRDPRRVFAAGTGPGANVTVFMTPKLCSDGMSDRLFGLEATVMLETEIGAELLLGCCSIAP
ncbi:COG3650 family protein [Halodurantibacterium flavum]|uniref:COG3650 family protein n=1 Tax=Halodurantibacterium flavum TaxID=1382802 RepID=A0ABW4SA05_9RHOB